MLVTSGADCYVKSWDVKSSKFVKTVKRTKQPVNTMAYNKDRRILLMA